MNLRKLEKKDKEQLDNLIKIIELNSTNSEWWLPIKKEARKHFFDEKWTIFYGIFERDRLIAACGLFLNKFEYEDTADLLKIPYECTAEIGRCMVTPNSRNNNYMFIINRCLLEEAEKRGRTNIVATAHPSNMASNKSLQKLGMRKKAEVTKMEKYARNIYHMVISNTRENINRIIEIE